MSENINEARRLLRKEAKKLGTALQKDKSRSRGPKVRDLHEVRQMLSPNYTYVSQAGQDAVVDQIMKFKRGGTFIDVGGYDGLTGSNTYFLETQRGWTGALVEPVSSQMAKAKAVRTCNCLEVAVAASEGEADFIEITEGYTQMSGLAETYDPKLLGTVRDDKRQPNPDFLSLDIEGGEIAALKAFPFADHDIKIWSIENNTGTPEIKQIMDANGYDLIEFCGPDEMYFKRSP